MNVYLLFSPLKTIEFRTMLVVYTLLLKYSLQTLLPSLAFHPSTVFLSLDVHMSSIRLQNCIPFARPIFFFFFLLQSRFGHLIPLTITATTSQHFPYHHNIPHTLRFSKHHIRPFALILHTFSLYSSSLLQ